jgi:hypothetical protein
MQEFKSRLKAIMVGSGDTGHTEHINRLLVDVNELMSIEWHEDILKTLLYNIEQLRKQKYDIEGTEEAEAE